MIAKKQKLFFSFLCLYYRYTAARTHCSHEAILLISSMQLICSDVAEQL